MTPTYYEFENGFVRSDETNGASDASRCPYLPAEPCRCGAPCYICGMGLHALPHRPYKGCEPGSRPYGHRHVTKQQLAHTGP